MELVGNSPLIDQVEVIITTRNRIRALEYTLDQCQQLGLKLEQISVTDDASTDGTSSILKDNYLGLTLYTNEKTQGYIANRNLMMRNSKRQYILSLDDDSNLLSIEDLVKALNALQSNDSFAVFCFDIIEQYDPPVLEPKVSTLTAYKSFMGCGHIIKRSVLDEIGYYYEELTFYGEENDFAIRCYQAGYAIIGIPGVTVHHRVNKADRVQQLKSNIKKGEYGTMWRSKMSVSNTLLKVIMYYPTSLVPFYFTKSLAGQFYFSCFKVKATKGYWQGLLRFSTLLKFAIEKRQPFSLKLFREWNELPMYTVVN